MASRPADFIVGDDGKINIISSSGSTVDSIKSKQGSVVALAWMKVGNPRDFKMILSAGSDGTVKLWRAAEGVR